MKIVRTGLARQFHRTTLHLSTSGRAPAPRTESYTVLVINSSQEMAREITMQLIQALPWCTILYAPTFGLARMMVRKREIDLVVSSSVMPDGGISIITDALQELEDAPDLVVVSEESQCPVDLLAAENYRFISIRKVIPGLSDALPRDDISRKIQHMGAEVRNDLNNPLQEIVAMVFVARAHESVGPSTNAALAAIECAAQNMAQVVWGLEERIAGVVVESEGEEAERKKVNRS